MFNSVENRLPYKGLKYWVDSCSQPTINQKKYSARKYVWHDFWKCERSWWDSKQNESLCWSSRPKESLRCYEEFYKIHKKTSVPDLFFLVFSCEFSCKICKNTFFAEQYRTTASDYSSINSSVTLLKRDFNPGAFLWNLQNFSEQLFLQKSSSGCFAAEV